MFLRKSDVAPYVRQTADQLLRDKTSWRADVDAAHEHCDRLNQLLPLVASDEHLYALLDAEFHRKESLEGLVTITGLFGRGSISGLLDRLRPATEASPVGFSDWDRREAQARLRQFYRQRDDERRHRRAVIRLRHEYLLRYGIVMICLTTLLGVAILLLDSGGNEMWEKLLLVAVAGALGSTLTATFKLRDVVGSFLSTQAVNIAVFLQPLIGAAVGIIAWLVVTADLVEIARLDNTAWPTQGILAFASGLSEPFIFRVIGRSIGPDRGTETR